jgi:predicted PurR-regulated permease PerM
MQSRLRLPRPLALGCSVALTGLAAVAAIWSVSILVTSQLDVVRGGVAASLERIRATPWGAMVPDLRSVFPTALDVAGRATGMITSTFGGLVSVAVGIFIGVCLAAEPAFYREGVVRLAPPTVRDRFRAVLDEVGATLRSWLFARVISMVALGVLVTIGLAALRIPFAPTLGALAGILAFIPNVGALVAAFPAVLFALAIGPERAVLVAAMYWAAHAVDDFLVIPVAERRIVKLPPALTILVQIALGSFAGVAGVALAAPLTATAIVLVRTLWVEETLELSD